MHVEAPKTSAQVRVGDLFGLHFPDCRAVWPHPAVIIKIFDEPHRTAVIKNKGLTDEPGKALCLAVMLSHSPPPKGEYARQLTLADIDGTLLDASKSIYVCFKHYRAIFLPGQEERRIISVEASYLGCLDEPLARDLMSNLLHTQRVARGDDPVLDRKIIRG